MSRDVWCPNCQQRVAPERRIGWAPTLWGWALFVPLFAASYAVPMPDPGIGQYATAVVVGLVVFGLPVVLWWGVRREERPRCPICRTTHLVAGQ